MSGSEQQERELRELRQEALMLNFLGAQTINLNRTFVDLTGNVVSALWLSWVIDDMPAARREGRGFTDGKDYVFDLAGQACERATGITRGQQSTCRKQLSELGILSDGGGGRGKTIRYRLHMDRLYAKLDELATPIRLALEQQHAASQQPRQQTRRQRQRQEQG
jgi:hypothetical protein